MENEFTLGIVSAAEGGKISLVRDCQEENITIYAPFGYSFCPPLGYSICTANVEGKTVAGAVPMPANSLVEGEVKIAAGGGYIHFKSGGDIVINGLIITKSGQMVPATRVGD